MGQAVLVVFVAGRLVFDLAAAGWCSMLGDAA
jgi:hypothetical protein